MWLRDGIGFFSTQAVGCLGQGNADCVTSFWHLVPPKCVAYSVFPFADTAWQWFILEISVCGYLWRGSSLLSSIGSPRSRDYFRKRFRRWVHREGVCNTYLLSNVLVWLVFNSGHRFVRLPTRSETKPNVNDVALCMQIVLTVLIKRYENRSYKDERNILLNVTDTKSWTFASLL